MHLRQYDVQGYEGQGYQMHKGLWVMSQRYGLLIHKINGVIKDNKGDEDTEGWKKLSIKTLELGRTDEVGREQLVWCRSVWGPMLWR